MNFNDFVNEVAAEVMPYSRMKAPTGFHMSLPFIEGFAYNSYIEGANEKVVIEFLKNLIDYSEGKHFISVPELEELEEFLRREHD